MLREGFLSMTQQMVRNMDIRVNKLFAEHGIKEPFKSHRMRHTVLTLSNNSRLADDKSLQAWAGHRDAARGTTINSRKRFSEYIPHFCDTLWNMKKATNPRWRKGFGASA